MALDPKRIADEKASIKVLKINEKMWLVFGAICVVGTGYTIITGDRRSALMFLIATFLCGFYYSFKKRLRVKREKYLEERMGK